MSYINKIKLGNNTYNIGNTIDIGYIYDFASSKNISNQFTSSGWISSIISYIKNGIVFVLININTNISEGINRITGFVPEQYRPCLNAYGLYTPSGSIADKDKINSAIIAAENGNLEVWANSVLSYEEKLTFSYPINMNFK